MASDDDRGAGPSGGGGAEGAGGGGLRQRGAAAARPATPARTRTFEGLELPQAPVAGCVLALPREGTAALVLARRLEQVGLLVEREESDLCQRTFLRLTATADTIAAKAGQLARRPVRRGSGILKRVHFTTEEEGGGGGAPGTPAPAPAPPLAPDPGPGGALSPKGTFSRWESVSLIMRLVRDSLQEVSCTPNLLIALPGDGSWEPLGGVDVLEDMKEYGVIRDIFVLHDEADREWLAKHWIRSWKVLDPPLEALNAYFGPGQSAYFGFLAHYTRWLFLAAAAAVWSMWLRWSKALDKHSNLLLAMILTLWAGLVLQFWKRQQNVLLRAWGTTPHFKFHRRVDEMPFSSEWSHKILLILGYGAVVGILVIVQIPICVLFVSAQYSLKDLKGLTVMAMKFAITGAQVLVTQQVNKSAGNLARWMNGKGLKGRRVSDEDSAIFKTFLFFAVNNYTIFFWYAFYLRDLPSLRQLLLMKLVIGQGSQNATEIIMPLFQRRVKTLGKGSKEVSAIEKEYLSPEYNSNILGDVMDGKYEDFLELAVQWGMVLYFSPIFPASAVFALINNLIEMRTDGFRLCFGLRSLRPDTAASRQKASIGVWLKIFEMISWTAVLVNALIFTYTWQEEDRAAPSATQPGWLNDFFVLEHWMVLLKVIPFIVNEIPLYLEKAAQ